MDVFIREEQPGDEANIREVIDAAFKDAPYGSGTEGAIVEKLRGAGALDVSLVATLDGVVHGHVAFSRITVDGRCVGWSGLEPVSVRPGLQGQGIGQSLVDEGLRRFRATGASGCVVLGNPAYYKRFGFHNDEHLRLEGVPASHFMVRPLRDTHAPPRQRRIP
ncbi:acetyltransferase (GNAT) domain-containing protein [Purpureocillium lilacinum]|uniref:Acetyltransferase (GNAT) domain-containing protein n=1 Tax=Purpureocillium lilacinum TaxID=33203 RepID=A0A179GNN3_PURLI|nr:acetyltransferase (GNAT) domain-containing protein [Purpureocillium lilacinum]